MVIGSPWPPLPPVQEDPGWGLPPFGFGPEDPNLSTQDLVSRQMCGSVHLDGRFANTVAGELLSIPHRAVWPAWHVDYVMLARHAKFSRERRILRDLGLCLLMLVLLFGWAVLALAVVTGRLPFGPALGVAVVIGLAVYAAAYLQVWAFYLETVEIVTEIVEDPITAYKRLDAWPGWPPPFTGLVSSVARVMHGFNAWFMRIRHEIRAAWRALQKRPRQDERPTQDILAHVASLENANVVLFSRNMKPFALAGVHLDSFTMTIDVTKEVNGKPYKPALSAKDLHHKLLAAVPTDAIAHLRAGSLLVASGMQPKELGLFAKWRRGVKPAADAEPEFPDADDVPGAAAQEPAPADPGSDPQQPLAQLDDMVDPRSKAGEQVNPEGWYLEHPDNQVDVEMIDAALEGPPEGARVYAYFQKYAWRGHLIVGAAVRVYRSQNTLIVEFDAHALPPLADGFNNVYNIPAGVRNRRLALTRTVVAKTPSLLFQSLRAMYSLYFVSSGRMQVVRQLQNSREMESRIDYGSLTNLRLRAGDVQKLWRFPYADELDFARVMRDRSLDVIMLYLESYGVPTAQFKEQIRVMRERKTNYEAEH